MVAGPILPLLFWLGGFAAFAVLAVNGLFAGPNPVFVIARVTAYMAAVAVGVMTVAGVAMFGLACGGMLTWLGEPLRPKLIVSTMGRSFWCMAVYAWLGAILLVWKPPVALTVFEMVESAGIEARVGETVAFAWMARLRYLALGAFLAVSTWLLARRASPVNALLSVAFGGSALAAGIAALNLLAGAEPG